MNGYFRLLLNEQGTFLSLIPETEDGKAVEVSEVAEYLDGQKIPYDVKLIFAGIQSKKEVTIPLSKSKILPVHEKAVIKVSPDKMTAVMRFYAPSNVGVVMDQAEIMNDLACQKIVYGIQQQAIDEFIGKREYCKDYVVAIGDKPVQGRDAVIEYFFNTDLKVRPTLLKDGSVDFFNLNLVNHCKKGDLLAKLHPEEAGKEGKNVFGEVLTAAPVKKKTLRFGRNISLSEDKTELTSDVNGHVMLVDDRVFVSNVYEVENVDNSTGNIEYDGSVVIHGNVCANFHVKAEGDIEVNGVVEGAFLEAGGNIVIGRGMNGMERGVLKAGGNVVAKFLENATVSTKGYVETEAILHCRVMAGTEVIVTGRRAFITGGNVSAGKKITAKTLGSSMAAATTVEVGVDPNLKTRCQELQKEIQEIQDSIKKIDPVVTATIQKIKQGIKVSQDQINYVKSLAATSRELHEKLERDMKESEDLKETLDSDTEASIVVTDTVYPGTKIVISGASLMIKEAYQFCRYKKVRGDVKAEAI